MSAWWLDVLSEPALERYEGRGTQNREADEERAMPVVVSMLDKGLGETAIELNRQGIKNHTGAAHNSLSVKRLRARAAIWRGL
jgi:hypothetical protein